MFIKSNERYKLNNAKADESSTYLTRESDFEYIGDSNVIGEFFASIKRILLHSDSDEYLQQPNTQHLAQNTQGHSYQESHSQATLDMENLANQNLNAQDINHHNSTQESQENKDFGANVAQRWQEANQQAQDSFAHLNNSDYAKEQASTQDLSNSTSVASNNPVGIIYHATTKINIRKYPNINSAIVGKLTIGDSIKVIKMNDEWGQLENGGWVSMKLLALESQSTNSVRNIEIYIAAVNSNIRQKPDNDSMIIGSIFKGEKVRVLTVANGWARLENGGYVAARLLNKN